jgi:hypothetical protein
VAKRFKDYDKMFSPEQINDCRQQWLRNGSSYAERMGITEWDLPVKQWSQEKVQHAVYHAISAEDWQLFRVSMKGLSTSEKLYMLYNRHVCLDASSYELEAIRIGNYIGALVRGGQLDSNYKVVK